MQVWKYEGSKTLAYYLRRRDTIPAIAADLGIPESAVLATVMKQIFESLVVRLLQRCLLLAYFWANVTPWHCR